MPRPIVAALAGLVFAAGGWLALASPAAQGADDPDVIELAGQITSTKPDWVYVPFEVPAGVTSISVVYDYDRKGNEGNTLDIGIFEPDSGNEPQDSSRFRGWSGGARSSFTISEAGATPGYLPGPVTPGRWHLILGPYRVNAQHGLNWTATVTLGRDPVGPAFQAKPAKKRINKKPGWYRGDLHVHTVHSDGTYLPEEVVSEALAAELDFVVSAEHNTSSASTIWGAAAGDRPLLMINGEEVTTRAGHFNAVGLNPGTWIDWRYRQGEPGFGRAVKKIRSQGGLVMANHPRYPQLEAGLAWEFGLNALDAIEVWNGTTGAKWHYNDIIPTNENALKAWVELLRKGKKVTAVGASDAHKSPSTYPGSHDQIGAPHTVVRAASLSQKDVVAAIKARRAYVAGSKEYSLNLTAAAGKKQAGIGGILKAKPRTTVTIKLVATGLTGGTATLHTKGSDGAGKAARSASITGTRQVVTWKIKAKKLPYLRVEVRQPPTALPGAMMAFTNPIWVTRP